MYEKLFAGGREARAQAGKFRKNCSYGNQNYPLLSTGLRLKTKVCCAIFSFFSVFYFFKREQWHEQISKLMFVAQREGKVHSTKLGAKTLFVK